jgi:hypothetical protein
MVKLLAPSDEFKAIVLAYCFGENNKFKTPEELADRLLGDLNPDQRSRLRDFLDKLLSDKYASQIGRVWRATTRQFSVRHKHLVILLRLMRDRA